MKQALIVVSSQTGFTLKYGQWLADAASAELTTLEKCSPEILKPYEVIVFGSGIYGGEYHNRKKFEKLRRKNADKTYLYYATGIYPQTERTLHRLRRVNFADLPENALFYFQGGLDRERLDPSQKALLVCYRAMIRRRGNPSPEEQIVLNRMQISGDYTDRDSIVPLVDRLLAS